MKPSEIVLALETAIRANRPAFIWGKPGIGKSSVVAQVAAKLDLQLIDLRMVLLDPVDLRGLPHVNGDGLAHWAQPAFLPRDGAGILFMDEYAQSTTGVMNASSSLVYDRFLGEYQLPVGWIIIAASNNLTDRAATNKLPSHIASRFVHTDFEIDQDDFTRHALTSGFRTEVVAFLRFRPELLHKFDAGQRSFPCPRSWEFVSQILDAKPDPAVEMALYAGCVGEGAAAEFTGFLRVFRTLPSPDAILLNPGTADVPTDPATLYAICGALARKATDSNFPAIVTYAGRMGADFGVCLIAESARRCPAVQQTRAFIQWASDNAEVQI